LPICTPLGGQIFNYTAHAPAAEGVRERRAFVAALLDRLTEEQGPLEVLSIAAGHFREASLAACVKRRRFRRCVALDSDAESLHVVRSQYGYYGVETMHANVRRLIARKIDIGQFDLVYSTGLFDYVGPAAGRRLVSVMFDMLRPGGRLVVANFLPTIRDAAYMETYMDWQLIYRTRHEMIDLTMEIRQSAIQDITLFTEDNLNIIFVEVRKK
jgi:SAM-dependent methyltransferase